MPRIKTLIDTSASAIAAEQDGVSPLEAGYDADVVRVDCNGTDLLGSPRQTQGADSAIINTGDTDMTQKRSTPEGTSMQSDLRGSHAEVGASSVDEIAAHALRSRFFTPLSDLVPARRQVGRSPALGAPYGALSARLAELRRLNAVAATESVVASDDVMRDMYVALVMARPGVGHVDYD